MGAGVLQPVFTLSVGPELIQGQRPGSTNELYVARSLDRLRHRYIYQYIVFDVRGVRGDYRIDFLVLTPVPLPTPLEVFGEFWHEGEMGAEDQFRLAQINEELLGEANEVAVIWGRESSPPELAYAAVIDKVGAA